MTECHRTIYTIFYEIELAVTASFSRTGDMSVTVVNSLMIKCMYCFGNCACVVQSWWKSINNVHSLHLKLNWCRVLTLCLATTGLSILPRTFASKFLRFSARCVRYKLRIVALLPRWSSVCLYVRRSVGLGRACIVIIRCTLARI